MGLASACLRGIPPERAHGVSILIRPSVWSYSVPMWLIIFYCLPDHIKSDWLKKGCDFNSSWCEQFWNCTDMSVICAAISQSDCRKPHWFQNEYNKVEYYTSRGFGGAIVRASAFHLWDCGFDPHIGLMTLMWKELVNALPKVVGFLWVLRFPPTGNVDRVGWD
jgi:hypothetical protein